MVRSDARSKQGAVDSAKQVQERDNANPAEMEQLKDAMQAQEWDLEIQYRAMRDIVAELEESRDRYADLYDFSPVGYVTFDAKGCITEINLSGAMLLGLERSRLIGVPMTVFVDKADLKSFLEHLRTARLSGQKAITECRLSSKNTKVKYTQFITMTVPGVGGEGLQYRTAIADITGLRSAQAEIVGLQEAEKALLASEERLQHYSSELAATNSELKAFAHIIAHDFRTPMVNLKGFSRELGKSLDELKQIMHAAVLNLPENSRNKAVDLQERDIPEALKFIDSSVDRLSRMVDALLKLARLGRRELIYKTVDLGELVTSVARSFRHQIERQGIQLKIGPLPQLETDQLALEQIFSNLLDNAIKFLDTNRQGEIALSCTHEGDEYLFCFEDNGRGIAAADLEKIFEIFSRVGKQDVPGEGMGLAYVRTMIRQLGGKVWCQSQSGVGTKIYFTVRNGPFSE